MDVRILNGDMGRTANHKMTVIGRCFCVQISQISESDQWFCVFFDYINTPDFVSPRIDCIWIILNWNVSSEINQQFIIDGHEHNNGKLGFEQYAELI